MTVLNLLDFWHYIGFLYSFLCALFLLFLLLPLARRFTLFKNLFLFLSLGEQVVFDFIYKHLEYLGGNLHLLGGQVTCLLDLVEAIDVVELSTLLA